MDPVKLDEIRKKRKAELKELKAELKKLKEERSLPGAKPPYKLAEFEKLGPILAEVAKKQRAVLREAYSNREPLILNLRLNSQQDPCASPPAFTEDGEGKEA